MTTTSTSEAQTAAIGRELAARLQPGATVLLAGDLGAGKTAFVRGMAAALDIPAEQVTSPTFTLIQEYRSGRLPLFHIDLYRLSPREVDDLGLDDLVDEGGIVAVEWPDRWTRPPLDAVRVQLTNAGEHSRVVTIDE